MILPIGLGITGLLISACNIHTAYVAISKGFKDDAIKTTNVIAKVATENLRNFVQNRDFKSFFKAITLISFPLEMAIIALAIMGIFCTAVSPVVGCGMGVGLLMGIVVFQFVKYVGYRALDDYLGPQKGLKLLDLDA